MKKLNLLYHICLNHYMVTGEREHPSCLLAMLIFQEKEKYKALRVDEGEFYRYHKSQIDEKIEQIMKDFELCEEDIIGYILEAGIICDNCESDKIWFVFSKGFQSLHNEIIVDPNKMPEQMYFNCFDLPEFMQNNKTKKKYKG